MNNIYTRLDKFRTNFTQKNLDIMEENKKILKKAGFSDAFIDMYTVAVTGAISVFEGFIDTFQRIINDN